MPELDDYIKLHKEHGHKVTKAQAKKELKDLMNVGKATCEDFAMLGIESVEDLAKADADELYIRLQTITGKPHDPCVWDVFAAAINEAKTGKRQPWWEWTKVRKKREDEGTFCEKEK